MSENKKPQVNLRIVKARDMPGEKPILKSDRPTQISEDETYSAEWITPPISLYGLKALVDGSSILPQCINAYKNNIAGFGIGVRYRDDVDETPEMSEEFDKAVKIVELLSLENDTKEVFEDVVEARETYGIAYLEVIRNLENEVVQIDFISETPSISKTVPDTAYTEVEYFFKGEAIKRQKRFCKYRQDIGGKTVYFKEFGDPRVMDIRSGKYVEDGQTLDLKYQANEILEFAIGTEPYGTVRWIGQALGVDGSRKAEQLNNNYFTNGRHTPLMIAVEGGTLSEDSYTKLQEYMDGIKGENGQHSFLLLEFESADNQAGFSEETQPKIVVKDLANILQKDELFQDYLENNRRRVQSSFQLPDLYVGYTTDFNRATAQTAQEVTEKQVFQPARKSLAWIINNKLLNGYQFKYVEIYFKEPDVTDIDGLSKILNITERAGGLPPNKAKEITYEMLGDTCEDYADDWGETPLAYSKGQSSSEKISSDIEQQISGLEQQIEKAATNHDDEIVSVLKEVRKALISFDGRRENG